MSGTAGVLLAVLIVAMIGAVVLLVRLNGRTLARSGAEQRSMLGLEPSADASRLAFVALLWRKAAIGRSAWDLSQGRYGGWEVRAFMFAPTGDAVEQGARIATRVLARGVLPLTTVALDWRTAAQRGVLVAVDYDGEPAAFRISLSGSLVARNARARELLGGRGSVRLRGRVPPARCVLRDGWFHLASYYVLPKWLGPYVQMSTQICRLLSENGVVRARSDSELPARLF